MGSEHTPEQDLYRDCIRIVLASAAGIVTIPMWDYLGCGKEAHINALSIAGGNWQWCMPRYSFTEHLIWHCRILAEICDRESKSAPVPPELEAALAEAETATKAEERTRPNAVNVVTMFKETAGLH